ncbi:MAG: glycosyltransferase family 1 protein [Candidatus Tectomicrobia bacterium]|nr:glycosyltransferase family 1 protein [Candidatus Tectomicrobia bacterium]
MKVLFGPFNRPTHLMFQGLAADISIKLFHEAGQLTPPADLVYEPHRETITEAMARQLGAWRPDVLIFFWAEHHTFPPGLDECPCFTLAIVCDWNRAFTSLRENLRRFDAIVAGAKCTQLLRDLGYPNVEPWEVYSSRYPLNEARPSPEKDYDIFFAGAYGPVYPRRDAYLRRIARLSGRWRVGLFEQLDPPAYYRALGRSRIAFNQSLQSDLNFRVYEIALSEALLFMEADNLEIGERFTDGVDCVLYNEENFEARLEYYLSHEEERRRIAAAGRANVLARPPRVPLQALLEGVRGRAAGRGRGARRFATRLAEPQQLYWQGVQAFNHVYQRMGRTWGVAPCELARQLLSRALELAPGEARAWNARAVLHACLASLVDNQPEIEQQLLAQAVRDALAAVEALPDYALGYFNLGQLFALLNAAEDAEKALFNCLLILEGSALREEMLDGLAIVDERDPFHALLFKVAWQQAHYEHLRDAARRLEECGAILGAAAWDRLGDLWDRQGERIKAAVGWQRSLRVRPGVPPVLRKLAAVLGKLGRRDERIARIANLVEVFWNDPDARCVLLREKRARGDTDLEPLYAETQALLRAFPDHASWLRRLQEEFHELSGREALRSSQIAAGEPAPAAEQAR